MTFDENDINQQYVIGENYIAHEQKKNIFFWAAKYFDDSLWWVINQKRVDR